MEDKQERIIKSLMGRADTKLELKRNCYNIKLAMFGGIVIYRSYSFEDRETARAEGEEHLREIRENSDYSDITFRDQLRFLEWYSKTHII
jgi:hypothetical protein